MSDDVDRVIAAVGALGAPEEYEPPSGYRSLALCVLDSVWSMGVRYASVEGVLSRYRAARTQADRDADEDTLEDLVDVVTAAGGAPAFALAVKNRQRTSPRNGILKAEAVLAEAQGLISLGVNRPGDLRAADPERLARVEAHWLSVPGQASAISWKYFLMLAGFPGVKPDRMIRRFLAQALGRGRDSDVWMSEAVELVTGAAARMGVDATALDHQIWLYQRAL